MAEDRGESPTQMEPLLVRDSSKHRGELADLALELAQKATGLSRSLPPSIAQSLATLVRSMNCYYSNLIEGHDTHPIDIERALKQDYSANPEKRDLQLEAKSHIEVQQWIDQGGLTASPFSQAAILEIHRRFCEGLPEDLLWVENPETGDKIKMIPGQFRQRDVIVGQHVAISPGALPNFIQRFEDGYSKLGKVDTIIASASAHHRLLWIHPFLDGNGRVARMMSYAIQREVMDTGGLWSIARGLARNVKDYKAHLASCDEPRQGDYDGRGNLSEERLAKFTAFFLKTCIDQVEFMEGLIEPAKLRARIQRWVEVEIRVGDLPPRSNEILDALLLRGELPRADVTSILGTGDRQARRITSALVDTGVLHSASSRAPFHLAFPAKLAVQWLPGLFPDKPD